MIETLAERLGDAGGPTTAHPTRRPNDGWPRSKPPAEPASRSRPASSWASAKRAPNASRRCSRSARATRATDTCRKSSCRTSCRSPARRCTGSPRAHPRNSSGRSPPRGSCSAPTMHLQAPPNLTDHLGALIDAGIDDWGGVSPVTPDHVNPERPWPALDALRAATEAAGKVLAPRSDRLSRVRGRSRRPGCTRTSAPPSWWRPTARVSPATTGGRPVATSSRPRCCRRRHRRAPGTRSVRCSTVSSPAKRSGSTRSSPSCSARGSGRRARRRGRRPTPTRRRRRRRDVHPESQHQLHERLHVQVPVLCLLEGAALAQPAGQPLSPRARGDATPRRRSRRPRRDRGLPPRRHPPRFRRRLLPRRGPRGEGGGARDPRPRIHRPRGHRRRAASRHAARPVPRVARRTPDWRPSPARRPRSSTTRCGP